MTAPTGLPIVMAVTGASGTPYAVRLLEVLLAARREVHLVISPAGVAVARQELGVALDADAPDPARLLAAGGAGWPEGAAERLRVWHHRDLMAPIASGSFLTAAMVVCPCSGGTLAAIACAHGENLVHRAAEVHLKERRKLVLVPRETPLSLPQLRNMAAAHEAGAVILPASPGFYHGARSIADLVDFVVARICDQLGVANDLVRRWGQR